MLDSEPQVLVVGAGPVGLVAALFLRQHGLRVEIVDTHQRATQHSYALAIHPRTMRVLDEAGVSGRLIEAGRRVTTLAYYSGSRRHLAVDYSRLGSSHPYLLVVRQSLLERALVDALAQLDVQVRWTHRLQALAQDAAGIRAEVAALEAVVTGYPVARSEWMVKRSETIRPAFVIGADGYDSAVRRMSGIDMLVQRPGEYFSIYEIEATGELPAEARVILGPGSTSVYWPLEDGRCRWGFQIPDATVHHDSMTRLRQLIAERAPWSTLTPTEISWSALAVFESRLAASFGRGSVWLAGDAAHQAAPVGVHSMNAGLVEARDLAARISQALRSGASVLDRFGAETRTAWHALLGAEGVNPLPAADAWVRENAARIFSSLPASGDDLDPLLRQVGLSAAPARHDAGPGA